MQYQDLKIDSKQNTKRKGRGNSSGKGKTAGRGTKGQNSRSGGGVRPGFEGGQNPLFKRVPIIGGFKSRKTKAQAIYTSQLNDFSGKKVNNELLYEAGLIESMFVPVKVITKGELDAKVSVNVASASKSAVEAINKAGGSFEETATPQRQKKK